MDTNNCNGTINNNNINIIGSVRLKKNWKHSFDSGADRWLAVAAADDLI